MNISLRLLLVVALWFLAVMLAAAEHALFFPVALLAYAAFMWSFEGVR